MITEREIWFTNAAEEAETEVPEVEWRAFSEGKLGGVMVQLLNNQLMAPDWKLRSQLRQKHSLLGILRTMPNRICHIKWHQKLQGNLKMFLGNEYHRSVPLFRWKITDLDILWSETAELEFHIKIASLQSGVSVLGRDICYRKREFLHDFTER